ncbi:uncharacterized protein LOC114736226 [Neltuma alba]|uniref:uncharacterized protein LOC114736226 n=1 Tax=Neltuma alba TaxID=207710 RepID=UPI0010A4EB91|nr:uncharacterized protein LOC114736226 [Prosopis alba]
MKVVLCRLRNAKPNNIDKGVREAFACLELSYDFLATPEAQRLLLICAMFPEDHDIVVEDLFRYGVGLGLCKDVDSFETARSQVRAAVNYLIDSSLLMHSSLKFNVDAPEYVKLHDMVLDVTLWIAFKKDGRCSQLEELYVPRHSRRSKNANCYEYLMGPTALMYLRRYNLEIRKHGRAFVFKGEHTRSLRLGQLNISILLPTIIKHLAQRATKIVFYELEGGSKSFMPDIIQAVRGMKELSRLCLQRCSKIECIIDKTTLHEDAVVLKLNELVLRDMDNLERLCRGPSPFSLFQKLERLTIFNCPHLLPVFPADCNLGNLKVLKVNKCPLLTYLSPVSAVCTLLSLEELRIKCCNELKHILEEDGGVDAWVSLRFPKLKILYVRNCCNLESVCPVFLARRFVQLQELSIVNALQMKSLLGENAGEEEPMLDQDETQIVLPLLEYLNLKNLPNLVQIYSERYHPRCPSIKTIEWRDCPNMGLERKYALKDSQLNNNEAFNLSLPILYAGELDTQSPRVEHKWQVIGDDEQEETNDSEMLRSKQQILGGLVPTQVLSFQYLCSLEVTHSKKLKFVFSRSTIVHNSLPKLTSLTLFDCEELEEIIAENEEHQIMSNNVQVGFPELRWVDVKRCNKLKRLFSTSVATILPQLYSLLITEANQLEVIFGHNSEDDTNYGEIVLSSLRKIELTNLPNFMNVCQGLQIQAHLSDIWIHNCPKLVDSSLGRKLKWLFPSLPSAQHLLQLKYLRISWCSELKGLFNGELEIHDEEGFCNNMLPMLRDLKVWDCPNFSKTTLAVLQRVCSNNTKRKMVMMMIDYVIGLLIGVGEKEECNVNDSDEVTRLTNDKTIVLSFLNTSYEYVVSKGCTSIGLTEEKCLVESSDGASSSANKTVHGNFPELSKFDSLSIHQVPTAIGPSLEVMNSIVESKVAIVNTTNIEKANPFGNFPSADCQVEVESSKHNAGFVEIPSTTFGHNATKNGTENMLNHPLGGNLEADEITHHLQDATEQNANKSRKNRLELMISNFMSCC